MTVKDLARLMVDLKRDLMRGLRLGLMKESVLGLWMGKQWV